jgi:hypothetical protein
MKFLSLTGLIAIQPITKERSAVTLLEIILRAICKRTVEVLCLIIGTTVSGMTMVVITTEKIGLTMVKLDQVSVSGLNATSLQTTKLIRQSVVQEKNNANITIATSMEMIVKMNFGTNVTGNNWIALGWKA